MEIVALSHSVSQTHNYAVILGELNGNRRLPIVIGGFEAQAIAVAIEHMIPNRPLTHDLFKNTLSAFDIEIREVIIINLLDGIFYSQLICIQDNNVVQIDARTSDALSMAVRFGCPIYTYDFILDSAAMIVDDNISEEKESKPSRTNSPENLSVEGLEKLLNDALEKEDYESAAQLRDLITKKRSE